MRPTVNPDLVGPKSPTPLVVYEPRIWAARIWVPGGPFEGFGFLFKAPYGQGMNAATILARACSRYQINRFHFGPASKTMIKNLDRTTLRRFEDAFEEVGRRLGIDWTA